MNILIINQPLNNRGDESAHKGLVRAIVKNIPEANITVLFGSKNESIKDSVRQFSVKSKRVRYVCFKPILGKGRHFAGMYALKNNLPWLAKLHPGINQYLQFFKKADYVVCAPGGMCMGGFMNWNHLLQLYYTKWCNKPLAYYGRSFGPFSDETPEKALFKKLSVNILKYFSFLSIRDKKTERIADSLGINNYVSVVDSAFLDAPKVDIPQEIKKQIGNNYFVFVPNLLIWHPFYKGKITKEEIIQFYCEAIDVLFAKYPDSKAVLLPQTFNYGCYEGDDIHLFREIAAAKNDNHLVVVDDKYSSDIQQTIIADAQLMVGSRYHSVVFALNNATPFIALSYEHKISGLLETIGKTDCMIDIETALFSQEGRRGVLRQLSEKIESAKSDTKARSVCKKLAEDGFNEFKKRFLNM